MSQHLIFTIILELIFLCGVNYIYYEGAILIKLIPPFLLSLWLINLNYTHLILIEFLCYILGDFFFARINSMNNNFIFGVICFAISNGIALFDNIKNIRILSMVPSYFCILYAIYGMFITMIITSQSEIQTKIIIISYALILINRFLYACLSYHYYNINLYEVYSSILFIISDILVFIEFNSGMRYNKIMSSVTLGTYWISLIYRTLFLYLK